MIEIFAKIFDTPTTQVLVYLGSDDNNAPVVFHILRVQGCSLSFNALYEEDKPEFWDKAKKYFDSFNQNSADELAQDAFLSLLKVK